MYTKFHGTNGQTAARWLRTIELEIPFKSGRHPYKWLESVDGLLIGDAACWADQHPKVKKLLTEENIKHATIYDVDTFIALFLERFAPLEKDCMLDISAKLKGTFNHPKSSHEYALPMLTADITQTCVRSQPRTWKTTIDALKIFCMVCKAWAILREGQWTRSIIDSNMRQSNIISSA